MLLLLLCLLAADPRPDVVFADFEADTYGDWKATGTAFGTGPARGTLPGQMDVSGYKGKGLVNSFLGGDRSTGTLTSPEFTVSRRYISFLVGGGHDLDKTCIQLLIDGKVVRVETGPNKAAGGTERLDPAAWDISEFLGKKAKLRIIDAATGGWGHINIDHIVFTDAKPKGVLRDAERELIADKTYLEIPVKTGGAKRRLSVRLDGKVWRDFEVELADGKPDFYALLDVTAAKGKKLTLRVERVPEDVDLLAGVAQTDTPREAVTVYREKHRPQYHFTSKRGWLNDPNGLVYHKGEWHLFYQHNPYGWAWGNMHWGHAVSKDLLHWQEQPIALTPPQYDDMAFSGSAVVDRANTGGFKTGDEDVLVAAFTSTGRGECIAYSNDRGRTWQEYAGNPVVRHQGRDPKLVWHAETKRWVMAVYDEHAGKQWIAFYTSADLKKWTFESRINGFFECPDLFELPVVGTKERHWVLYAADGQYVLGAFDGKRFVPAMKKQRLWHGNFYAAQTYSDAPDGRRVQVGWGQGIDFPGMPFNQQMTIPCELTLRSTPDGVRMFAWPVKEVEALRGKPRDYGARGLVGLTGDLLDLEVDLDVGKTEAFRMRLRGVEVGYDAKKEQLACGDVKAALKPVKGHVQLRVLVDRGSIEVFANDGVVAVSKRALDDGKGRGVEVLTGSEAVRLFRVAEVRSVWAR